MAASIAWASPKGTEEHIKATWTKFHAIQMRTPVQRAADYPPGDWWKAVWQYLYDQGLREDVTPQRLRERGADEDEA